ncbi:peptidoglycan DD-metalloendopeptidase family protein [Tepidiphilus margaritifer]|uniref:peptidoglycan DD-metalloendopeptidase family protein n=1 Tax=Tepidiphilus margaritifer TaxID=203471 RepID=UPI0003F4D4F3|nr:peptidoglycan DD-metalloendopeptidase family protein [Tepidiphilus margaritifer]
MTNVWNRRVAFLLGWTVVLAGCSSAVKAPVADRSTGSPSTASTPAAKAPEAASGPVYHVVQPGETLRGIARQYGVTTEELISLNQLSDPNRIVVGQRLKIREGAAAVASPGAGVQVVPVPVEGGPEAVSAAPVVTSPKGGRTGAEATPAPVAPKAEDKAPAAASEGWQWPADGQILTRFNGTTVKGIDIGGKVGDPVRAALDGTVSYTGEGIEGYGLIVIIQHPNDYVSVYAHNSKVLVKEGQQVKRGEVIAAMGQTGKDVKQPKLHFQIRKAGQAIDPLKLLPPR